MSTRLLTRLDRLDLALYRRAARADTPALDRVLPRLTSAADHGGLWFVVAAGLAASGGRRRRAALRGLLSLGLESATANVPAKLSARRARPVLTPVPVPRHLLRQPSSSSFPSGHSASAAAFAIGVAMEQPALALPIGLLAGGVAYGRVHTGVHYPGDVVAGLALGAAGAYALTLVWPLRPDRPAAATPASFAAPALPEGDGLIVVVNTSAGAGDRADEVERELKTALPQVEVVRLTRDSDLVGELRKAAARARVLGVAGGDGTVNAAAGAALEAGIPLAVVPGGTLDHFAGELGIATVADVAKAVHEGTGVQITVASAAAHGDGLHFLNTFALGIYPDLVKEREKREDAIGKWPALLVALATTLRGAEPITVQMDGEQRRLWTLFAGNGHYHPAGFAPSWRERMDDGCIDVRLIDADKRFARSRLVAAVLTGRLGRSRVYEERVVAKLTVQSAAGGLRLARDGEVEEGPRELVLHAASDPLIVYRPV